MPAEIVDAATASQKNSNTRAVAAAPTTTVLITLFMLNEKTQSKRAAAVLWKFFD
ncbi:hypothetical protein [Dyadobacter sp. 50-39]|uniref:hypothetical protein n=1 Tax=Dyadobacter sp. 50-39 TaxID=1895756 RepID=UPI000A5D610D|nr:hypothetical protein [Dyadobacter sp. 50-39]